MTKTERIREQLLHGFIYKVKHSLQYAFGSLVERRGAGVNCGQTRSEALPSAEGLVLHSYFPKNGYRLYSRRIQHKMQGVVY
jgi:hypothetical protein